MTYISWLPSMLLPKAIFVPSGDQLGSVSHVGLVVNLVWLLPSAAFMTYISWFSNSSWVESLSVLKAIFVPSGDHLGLESFAGSYVSWVSPLPSAFMTYMLEFPSRSLSKAIFV